MPSVKYRKNIHRIDALSKEEQDRLALVAERYAFRANDYYLSLINWEDPLDPIRQIVVPQEGELDAWGALDASNEADNYVAPGCQHKYSDTALLLVNETCGAYCRFCFRKRLFMNDNEEVEFDPTPGIDYIREHPEISNVLLTGGDPLLLSTGKLRAIITRLREIDHVKIIRIGSKMPAFNPFRILDDPALLELLESHSCTNGRIYLMAHFNHPRELTREARSALDALHHAGVMLVNQTPIIRGVNSDPKVLAELMQELSWMGVPPYYMFQCRPTEGNKPFEMPIVESWELVREAMTRVSGLARRARLTMSHASGKVEVPAVTRDHIICRYHRARNPEDDGRVMVFHRDDNAYWLDDLRPVELEDRDRLWPRSKGGAANHRGFNQ
ncbi:MAG: KamA family radical SAM protein [Candidatus Krumholzibacteria bacterium]|jgi:KamA family protein|nr:KamA family radical SAM protein [Candidatus Krumholzibacteria bacterium]MDP7022518.1 KamA family radical SAM protein [Candidatus Krumholzibacteria bacterium]